MCVCVCVYTHVILEVVAGRIVYIAVDIHRYAKCTYLNFIKPFEDVVKSAHKLGVK
jgi:hypothetical protein